MREVRGPEGRIEAETFGCMMDVHCASQGEDVRTGSRSGMHCLRQAGHGVVA